jgi:hypothetical protein
MAVRHPLNARVLATAAVLGMLATLGGWGWLSWQTRSLQQQLRPLQAQVQARQQQLAELQARLPSNRPDPALQARVRRLEKRWAALQQTIALLDARQRATSPGYSPLLRGLASKPLQGLWLSEIRIGAPQGRIDLKGLALEPAAVPRMLHTLGRQPAFDDLRFGQARITRGTGDAQGPITFELRGLPREGEQHAG